jgi:hypothetical protein
MSQDVLAFWARATPRVVCRRDGFEWDDRADRAPTEFLTVEALARRVRELQEAERPRLPARRPSRAADLGAVPSIRQLRPARSAAYDLAPAALSAVVVLASAACLVAVAVGALGTFALR